LRTVGLGVISCVYRLLIVGAGGKQSAKNNIFEFRHDSLFKSCFRSDCSICFKHFCGSSIELKKVQECDATKVEESTLV